MKPAFVCTVRNALGETKTVRLYAASSQAATENLREAGYSVTAIQQENEVVSRLRSIMDTPSQNDIVFAERRLAMLLKNGIDLSTGLRNLATQTVNPVLRSTFDDIHREVMSGDMLSQSLVKRPEIFPSMMVGLTRAGEETGKLGDCIDEAARLGMRNLEIRSRVRSAFLYPIIVLIMATGIVLFFMVYVLPQFNRVFATSGVELPLPTQILLLMSSIVIRFWWLIILGIGGAIYGAHRYYKTEDGHLRIDYLWLTMPAMGPIILLSSLSRVALTIASLIRSGVSVDHALEVASAVCDNVYLEQALVKARSAVMRGSTLSESLGSLRIIPPLMLQMVSSGEESGATDQMLAEVGEFYDLETTHAIRNLVTILEPIILIVMGVVVLSLALAVMLPLFKMSQMYR